VGNRADLFGGAGGRGHRQDARATLDKRTGLLEGIFGADLNGAKVGRSGMKGYAAFLQNGGVGRGGTQSVALGWYTVSLWDTGRRKDEGWAMGQTSSVVLHCRYVGSGDYVFCFSRDRINSSNDLRALYPYAVAMS
jgi:hypothetical protein